MFKRTVLRNLILLSGLILCLPFCDHGQSTLWGVTPVGGTNNFGTIYHINDEGGNYTIAHNFNDLSQGRNPSGLLTPFNGSFYGMTRQGGASNQGVIYKIDPSTNSYTKLKDFNDADGTFPQGHFTAFNNKLYGTTPSGGSASFGVIFEFNPATASYAVHVNFGGSLGQNPLPLTLLNSKLYGVTNAGGNFGFGVLFEFDPGTNTYSTKYDFQFAQGWDLRCPLVALNNKLYGMTSAGGSSGIHGTLFEFDPATEIYTTKLNFNGTNGAGSNRYLIADNVLWGVTEGGGNFDKGVAFAFDPINNTYAHLFSFSENNGIGPVGAMVRKNEYLWGTTQTSGFYDNGTIFRINSITQTALILHSFNAAGFDGASPLSGLIECNGFIFYEDADGDGYGNPAVSVQQCSSPSGYVTNDDDCNDNNAAINPGAAEVCDGVDNNCDGQVDEGLSLITSYVDNDDDGYGNPNISVQQCSIPQGYVPNSGDCNDGNGNINPGTTEVCGNNTDDNCNGQIDEGCAPLPSVSITDVTVYESQGPAVLTVSLSNTAATPVKINYKTIDGTAAKAKDYKNSNGNITIPAGSLSTQITVAIIQDNNTEASEYFDVQLSVPKVMGQPQPVIVADDLGRVTILDGVAPAITKAASKNGSNNKPAEVVSERFNVRLMSNPSKTDFTLNIETNSPEVKNIRVVDIHGRVVKQITTSSSSLRFGNDLNAGVYIIEVQSGVDKKTLKGIKL